MKTRILMLRFALFACASLVAMPSMSRMPERTAENVKRYTALCRKHIYRDMKGMYREAGKSLVFPFLAPGSNQYLDMLWDWDSWLSNVALRQILLEHGTKGDSDEALRYEQGCVLNALHEYYLPDNGEPVLNKGFQNWNLLVLNMAAWLEGKPVVEEFVGN